MLKTAILLPMHNEEKTIEGCIRDFQRHMPEAEIYVCNNCSSDRSVEIVKTLQESFANIHLLHEPAKGKGNAVRRLFREVDAECYIMADSDMTYPAAFAPVFEKKVLKDGRDMVTGDRLSTSYHTENKRRFHGFGNKLVKGLVNRIFGAQLKDIMTGARGFSYEFVKTYPALADGFEVETDMTVFALQNRFDIEEVEIEYKDRPAGSVSKLNTYSDGLCVLARIVKLFKTAKPFAFFTLLACILFATALLLFGPVFLEFVETGAVPRQPTLIISVALGICSILTFFTGIILEDASQARREQLQQRRVFLRTVKGRAL